MSNWKEQLQKISRLRAERRHSADDLYSAQIGIQKIEDVLKRINRREAAGPADPEAVKNLGERIGELERSLQDLNLVLARITGTLAAFRENAELIAFLDKKIELLDGEIAVVTDEIARARENSPPDREKIKELEKRLDELSELRGSLGRDLETASTEKEVLRARSQAAADEKQELDRKREDLRQEISRLREELNSLLISQDQSPEEAERAKRALEEKYRRSQSDLAATRVDLENAVASIYVDPHPRSTLSNLDDGIPFLLMPVRLETRFATTDGRPELWLRIYPDDIAIHTHEPLLTDTEVAEGEKYWKAIFEADKNEEPEREDQKKQAWSKMAGLFGAPRSAWVALETKPTNWEQRGTFSDPGQLIFPVPETTKAGAWSLAPRVYELPDRFVVMLYEGNQITAEVTGNIIPDELFVGPDPMEADAAFVTVDEMLDFGEAYDWTSNFDKAVQIGMGFRIPLTTTQAARGFKKIVVLGLSLSLDELEGQKNLEALLDNHHYSSSGLSFVPQGTPTNNTDQSGSGFTTNDSFDHISYFVETGDPLFTEESDCDGKNLADALGISYAPLDHLRHSDSADLKEAVAMNTALYASTLGYYFDTMLRPVLREETQDRLRSFFIGHVTGRGPLPAIRVGDQPYGILLTSDFGAWQWSRQELGADGQFLRGLQEVLDHYAGIWLDFLPQLLHTGKPGADPSEVLMNILGLQAASVSFNQRVAYSTDDLLNRAGFKSGERYARDLENAFADQNQLLAFFATLGYSVTDAGGNLRVPQLLRLVYQHFHHGLDAANLIENVPLSESDQIRFYDADAQKNYIDWLIAASSVSLLEQQQFGTGIVPPTSLLYLQLRRSLLLQLNKSTHRWFKNNGITIEPTLEPMNFHNIRQPDVTKWEVMKGRVAVALPDHPQKDLAVADFLLTTGSQLDEAAFLNKMKASLETLARVPTARLERCFTEHIDTLSYRLDSWQSAFFHRRLKSQRQNTPADGETPGRKMGVYLGSYGWVEDVRPSSKRVVVDRESGPGEGTPVIDPLYEYADNGGFVHTPSLNHALAAAVLRAGYLNHASSQQPETMAVNLSSQRVRRALFILEGIRNGNSIEALLGYQFERGLHDRGSESDSMKILNAYIYDFRDAFPLPQHLLEQEGAPASTVTIPATNVVNGLTLAEDQRPFPFGAVGPVTSATPELRDAVIKEKNNLADTLDAVKDLLLSESVYHLVQGNFDRCAAVMSALKDSNIPPGLEIIKTPRSSRFTFTNRVTIHFERVFPDETATPRARMEAGINKWLGTLLGDPSRLAFRVSHIGADGVTQAEDVTVAQLEIQPIDLIYIIGQELNTGTGRPNNEDRTAASELETRIAYYYRKANVLADEIPVEIEFLTLEQPADRTPLGNLLPLLRMLKALLTDSRSLNAEDFVPPVESSSAESTNPKGYDAEELLQRLSQAKALFDSNLIGLNETDIFLLEPVGTLNGTTKLSALFSVLAETGKNLADLAITLDANNAANLLNTLVRVSNFGLPDSFPLVTAALGDDQTRLLLGQVQNVIRQMTVRSQKAIDIIDEAGPSQETTRRVEKLLEAGRSLFGEVFNILPLFAYSNPIDIQKSHGDREQLLKYAGEQLEMTLAADEWLQNISLVRPRLFRWDSIRTLHELLNQETLEIQPIQLPYRANDSWIAVEFPPEVEPGVPFDIDRDTLSILVHGSAAFENGTQQSGLLVDEIVEMIPSKEEITGIGFNYNQPNSAPPQTLLLAVTPRETGQWDWDELVGILNDTFLRAKLRAVEPALLDRSERPEIGVLLPAILANFSEYDLDLALDYRVNVGFFADHTPVKTVLTD